MDCKKALSKNKISDFRIYCTKWENFQNNEKYDIITSFHSFYYINPESAVKIFRKLNKGGVAIIIIEPIKNNIPTQFRDFLRKLVKKHYNSEDVIRVLKTNKIRFKIIRNTATYEPLLTQGKISRTGKIIATFLCKRNWKLFSKHEVQKMEAFLSKICKNDKPFNYYVNAIVIKR